MQLGQMIGWVGTALVVIAYLPQIYHLLVQKCAWGISILTWVIWLAGSVLLLGIEYFAATFCLPSCKA